MIDDVRKHKRLDVELELSWSIDSQGLSGPGKLLDVSVPGACFRIDREFVATAGLTFTLEATGLPALPKRGRLRWYRKLAGRAPSFLCGVIFIHEEAEKTAWSEWLDGALAAPTEQKSA